MVTNDKSITHHHLLPTYCCPCCPSRDSVDMVNVLYNQVDEEVHKLVILSNKSLKQLESLLEVRRFEEQTEQVGFSRQSVRWLVFWHFILSL